MSDHRPGHAEGRNSGSKEATAPQTRGRSLWRNLLRIGVQCVCLLTTLAVGVALLGVAQRRGWLAAGPPAAPTIETIYACPMHPEVRQSEPGACPQCGMELVATAAAARSEGAAASGAGAESARYVCPMMCTPPSATPGRCPVCAMELVSAGGGAGGARSVSIDAATRRIVGIRTAPVERGALARLLRTVGMLAFDEERVATIAAYVDGRLEQLLVEYEGQQVAPGEEMIVLYSPSLYSAQAEYLATLDSSTLARLGAGGVNLTATAREGLLELGMTAAQIDALRERGEPDKRLRIASPIGGTVIAKQKLEGEYVQVGEPVYRVVDLSMVWLMLELYPSDAALVRYGQQVEVEIDSLPGETYLGRVAFVAPVVDARTRTVSVRVEMSNLDGRLRPGDYATATLQLGGNPAEPTYDAALAGKWISPRHPQIVRDAPGACPVCGDALRPAADYGYADAPPPGAETLSVPRSAVLAVGPQAVVYVEEAPGEFALRQVATGVHSDARIEILAGLEPGEQVATAGAFLIDSQMQLTGKPSLRDPGGTPPPTAEEEAAHAH